MVSSRLEIEQLSQGGKFQEALTRISEMDLINSVGFPVLHTLAKFTCFPQHPMVAGCHYVGTVLVDSTGRATLWCRQESAVPWLVHGSHRVGVSTLDTNRTVSPGVSTCLSVILKDYIHPLINIHNKDRMTVKLLDKLTEVKVEMSVGGRLLSWDFTRLRGHLLTALFTFTS